MKTIFVTLFLTLSCLAQTYDTTWVELWDRNDATSDLKTEGNSVAQWFPFGCTRTVESSIVKVGSYALKGVFDGTSGAYCLDSLGLLPGIVANDSIVVEFWYRHTGTGGRVTTYFSSTTGGADNVAFSIETANTTYARSEIGFRYSNQNYLKFRESSGTNDGGFYADSISVRKMVLTEVPATASDILEKFNWFGWK